MRPHPIPPQEAVLILGKLLTNTLLHCDLARMKFRRLPLKRRADCAVCGHGVK